jgi:hypothetical protein
MYQGVEYKKSSLAVAIAGVVLLGGAFFAARSAKSASEAVSRQERIAMSGLQSQQQEFINQNVTPARLAELEATIQDYDRRLVSSTEFNAMIRGLGANWQFASGPVGSTGEATGQLACFTGSVADWSTVVDVLGRLEKLSPAIGISTANVATDGDATTRRFVRLRFGLVLRYAPEGEAKAAAASNSSAPATL